MSMAATTVLRMAGCRLRNAGPCQGTRAWELECTPCRSHVLDRHSGAAPREPLLDRGGRAPVRRAPAPASGGVPRGGGLPGSVGPAARGRAGARARAGGLSAAWLDDAAEHGR